jgi:hypothetical protein
MAQALKHNSHCSLHGQELWFSDLCCCDRDPDGADAQGGLADWVIHQNHVGCVPAFPVCTIQFNLMTFTYCQHISWPSSYAYWANSDLSSKPSVKLYSCSLMCTFNSLLVLPTSHLQHSHGKLYTHCLLCWTPVNWSSFYHCSTERSFLVFKIVLTLNAFSMRLYLTEMPLKYQIMTVPIASWWPHNQAYKFLRT